MASLHSPTLSFSRDGRFLVVADAADLLVVDAHTQAIQRIVAPGVTSAIAFSDQIWAVRGSSPVLERWRFDGTPIGSLSLEGEGDIVAAAVGPTAALWTAEVPRALIEEGGELRFGPGPRGGALAIPLTGRRWITASGSRVMAPSGLTCELPSGSRVTAGAIIFEGAAVAVVVERPNVRELAVIGLANGRLQLRHGLPSAVVRIAARVGVAAVLAGRTIRVMDLRSGRVMGEHHAAFEIVDFAIDPDGELFALRGPGERLHLELLRVREAIAVVAKPDEDELPVVVEAIVVEEAAALESTPIVAIATPTAASRLWAQAPITFDLRSLHPREPVVVVERTEALAMLGRDLRLVALRALSAISQAWDTRRLGYGNEGRHPYEHEVAALVGMNQGFAQDYVASAREHLALHASEAPLADRRAPNTPLGALATELGLSPLAIEILLVVAAPALRSEVARLYGILANDPARPVVDEALIEQVLGDSVPRHELAAELDARAPLVRLGVIEVESRRSRPFAAMTIDPVILARLRREDPDLGLGLTVRGSDRAVQELALGTDVLPTTLAAFAASQAPARIVLRGRPGSGRRTLLAALAADAHRALGLIDAMLLPRTEREFVSAVRHGLRRVQLAGLLPCVVGLETVAFDDRRGCDVIVEVLRAHPGPLAVVLPPCEAAPFDPGHIAIELPVLAEGERLEVWTRTLADAGIVVRDAEAIAARYRIGPGMIHRAIAAVKRDGDATEEIDAYLRQTRDARLGAYARRVERLATWDQVVLASDIMDSLRELIARVRYRRTVFETWGMGETMSTSRGLTALFAGLPGTGKTLVAGLIARELGLDLYQVDLSKVMSKWIGETERNLGTIFDAAEDGQVILLFDEADSLFAKRTEVRSSNDRYANLEVNYLLQRLDSFEGIAVLTTNAVGAIDPAFKRRLSFRLSFPFPDEETREQLWRAHLPAALPVSGPLALDRLARKYQLAGGYIRNACLRAAFLAAQDGGSVTQHHLERAVALEFAEFGKLSSSGSLD